MTKRPAVTVPVLSNTTSVAPASVSRARARVSAAPWRSSWPAAEDSAIGAASASAQGQVATSTAIATQRSCSARPATSATAMTTGVSARAS